MVFGALLFGVLVTSAIATEAGAREVVFPGGFPGGIVSVINTATNRLAAEAIDGGFAPQAIAISPDGSRAYVANAKAETVSVIDTTTDRPAAKAIKVGDFLKAIAITPDGSRAYVVNSWE